MIRGTSLLVRRIRLHGQSVSSQLTQVPTATDTTLRLLDSQILRILGVSDLIEKGKANPDPSKLSFNAIMHTILTYGIYKHKYIHANACKFMPKHASTNKHMKIKYFCFFIQALNNIVI